MSSIALSGAAESNLVGRQWEMSAVEGLLDRAVDGHGAVVVRGRATGHRQEPSGARGVCDGSDPWCRGVHRLLRVTRQPGPLPCRGATAARGHPASTGLDGRAARDRARAQIPDADEQDLLLVDDLLGIADTPGDAFQPVDPDARRRRLTALVNAALLARTRPALYVIEDPHWIDEVSESMLADFFAVIPADPVDGGDHLPSRVRGNADAYTRCANDCTCAVE